MWNEYPDILRKMVGADVIIRLEMFAAGLSLVTILEKEANLRKAFDIILIPTYDA